jgi:hypothetical protein
MEYDFKAAVSLKIHLNFLQAPMLCFRPGRAAREEVIIKQLFLPDLGLAVACRPAQRLARSQSQSRKRTEVMMIRWGGANKAILQLLYDNTERADMGIWE